MRRTKMIVLWSFGALVLAATAAVVFLAVAGDDFYRWAMRQAIEGTIGREIRADGTFSFNVGLEPALIVTDVWIENASWANKREMVRAKRVEIQIALGPLFSGIVRIPRLVVEGLDLGLETSSQGENNWEFNATTHHDQDVVVPKDFVYPLFEFVSLKDIAVTYRDHRSGRDTEILLDFLHKNKRAQDASFEIQGEGSFNQRVFQITGRFGSIEEALAATAPYPLELMLQSSSLVVDLTGTAQNLAAAEGFDLDLIVQTSSIGEVLRTLEIDLPLVGIAEASARLRGDLETLAVEGINLEIIERSGQELHAQGRLADFLNGQGLDLQFTGKLGPEALRLIGGLPVDLSGVKDDIAQVDFMGQMMGDLEALVVKGLNARLEHGSGADLSLQGGATLGFSENGIELTGFEATTLLSLPDQSLLEQVLRRSLPNLGAIRGTAQLAWAGDWIMLRSAEAEMQALERLQLKAEGRIGKLSGESFAFDLVPRIDLSAAVDHSPPLVYLIEELVKEAGSTVGSTSDPSAPATPQQATSGERNLVLLIQHGLEAAGLGPGRLDGKAGPRTRAAIEEYQARHGLPVDGQASKELLRHLEETVDLALAQTPPSFSPTPSQISRLAASLPELGPVTAALQVSRDNAAYHLDALNLSSGAMGAPQIEVTGTLGVLRPEGDPPLEDIALQVSFAVPSSQAFAQVFSPHVPDFTDVRGRFDLQGTVQELSISNVRLTARGPDGLAVTVNGRVAKLSAATGFSPEDLALDLDARWPNSESVYGFVDLDLPELGPVWARATLRDSGEIFRLTGIDVTVGSEEQPAVLIAGEVGDVLAFEEVKLSGVVDVATVTLLESEVETRDARLGTIHGRFDLSDRDGSLGLEALSAEVEDTKLLSLSVVGLFDDIERGDDLRLEASLTVPDVSRLVQELGYEAEPLGSLSFEGEVSGSDERFRAEGEARIGETNLTGTLSGTLTGDRPALRAKLYSPLFRFADVGLVPQQDEAHAPWEPETQPGKDEPGQGKIFGETPIPFEALRQIDLDLDVLFDDLEGVHLDIDNAEARLNLVEGMLRVDPLSFNFVGGRVELTLEIDGKEETPKLHLGLAADDVDLGDFLLQTGFEVPLDGELDLLVDLRAAGQSARALASSLKGEFDLAMVRGHVRTSLLELTTTDPINWLFTESARKGYSGMNCLILRFDFEDGLAESQIILLDTPDARTFGEGHLDLRDETIDLHFSPKAKSKRLIAMSTPFAITGPLAKPSVEISTGGAAARTVGEVLLSPINLLGSLLPFVSDRGEDGENPCLALLQDGLSRQ